MNNFPYYENCFPPCHRLASNTQSLFEGTNIVYKQSQLNCIYPSGSRVLGVSVCLSSILRHLLAPLTCFVRHESRVNDQSVNKYCSMILSPRAAEILPIFGGPKYIEDTQWFSIKSSTHAIATISKSEQFAKKIILSFQLCALNIVCIAHVDI